MDIDDDDDNNNNQYDSPYSCLLTDDEGSDYDEREEKRGRSGANTVPLLLSTTTNTFTSIPIEKNMAPTDSPDIMLSGTTESLDTYYYMDMGSAELDSAFNEYINHLPAKFIKYLYLYHPCVFYKELALFRGYVEHGIYISFITNKECIPFMKYLIDMGRLSKEDIKKYLIDINEVLRDGMKMSTKLAEFNVVSGMKNFNANQTCIFLRNLIIDTDKHLHIVLGGLNVIHLQLSFLHAMSSLDCFSPSSFSPSYVRNEEQEEQEEGGDNIKTNFDYKFNAPIYIEPGRREFMLIPVDKTVHFFDYISKLDHTDITKAVMSTLISFEAIEKEVNYIMGVLQHPKKFKILRFRNERLHQFTTRLLKGLEMNGKDKFDNIELNAIREAVCNIMQAEYSLWFCYNRTQIFTGPIIQSRFYFGVLDSLLYINREPLNVNI